MSRLNSSGPAEARDSFRTRVEVAFNREFAATVPGLDPERATPEVLRGALEKAGDRMLPDLEAAVDELRTALIDEVPTKIVNHWATAVTGLERFIVANVGYRSLELPVGRPASRPVLERLHGRAIVTAWEVAALIRASLPAGASARWRSLHELAVTAVAIATFGDEIAVRYEEHESVRAWRVVKQIAEHGEHWELISMPKETFERAEQDYQEALAKHGKEFRLDYEWARPALPHAGPRIQFADIEDAVGGSPWRMKYVMASQHVHVGDSGGSLPDDHGWENPYLLPRWTTPGHGLAGGEAAMSMLSATRALVVGSLAADDVASSSVADFTLAALEAMLRKVDAEFEKTEMDLFGRIYPTWPS